jgi:hypothetical protein
VSDAGCGSRILRLRRKIPLLSEAKELKSSLFRFTYLKTGSYAGAQRLFKSFLARNELVAWPFCVVFAR